MTVRTGLSSPEGRRTRSRGRWLPVVLWATMLLLTVAGDVILLVHWLRSPGTVWEEGPSISLDGLAFGTVGLLIAVRRRENAIGWLFLAAGVLSGVQLFTGEFAMYDRYILLDSESHAAVWGWVTGLSSVALLGVLPFALLLFPNGRFLSRRWRRFAQVSVVVSSASLLWLAVLPGELGMTPGLDNPFGVHSDAALLGTLVRAPFELGVGAPLLSCVLVGVVSLLVRWRASGRDQRAQLKWVLFAAAIGFSSILVTAMLIPVAGEGLNTIAWYFAVVSIPVAVGVSIMRYRLYAIDRIISRTVSYGLVTGLLVAVYAGLVTAVSRYTPASSSPAVAMSTLAVAALFRPLRRRVQVLVDRRFNRPRYDAARTIETFTLELRDRVDLEVLAADLLTVVHQTMQPARAGLWLRDAGGAAR
jgi:hypothetical protein